MGDYIFVSGKWEGHSQNDTPPSPVGKHLQRRYDTDTKITYYSDGSRWVKLGSTDGVFESYDYIIKYDPGASNKYAGKELRSGSIIQEGATLDEVVPDVMDVIQALPFFSSPIPRGGNVYIDSGFHVLSSSFTGFDIPEFTSIRCPPNCIVFVPNGYDEFMWRMNGYTTGQSSATQQMGLLGGYFREAGTPQNLWDGLLLQCNDPDDSGALYSCFGRDFTIANALHGIHLKTTDDNGLSFINGCQFMNIQLANCEKMIRFNQNGKPLYAGGIGFASRNEFISIVGQAGSDTVHGVQDITGKANQFIGCKMWDMPGGGITSNITAAAFNTQILGGIMTSQNFVDLGVDSFVFDDIVKLRWSDIELSALSGPIRGKKFGRFDGTSTSSGSGIFSGGFSQTGGAGAFMDTVNGMYSRFDTGAVSGNTANMRYANPYTVRAFNPFLGIKFMLSVATNNRTHIGFKTTPTTAVADGTDDPLANISGVMIAQRAADNTFQICSNNGSANSNFAPTGVSIVANTIYTIKFRAVGDSKFQYSLNGGAWTDITTQIPASTTAIGVYAGIQTAESAIHQQRIYGIETQSDK